MSKPPRYLWTHTLRQLLAVVALTISGCNSNPTEAPAKAKAEEVNRAARMYIATHNLTPGSTLLVKSLVDAGLCSWEGSMRLMHCDGWEVGVGTVVPDNGAPYAFPGYNEESKDLVFRMMMKDQIVAYVRVTRSILDLFVCSARQLTPEEQKQFLEAATAALTISTDVENIQLDAVNRKVRDQSIIMGVFLSLINDVSSTLTGSQLEQFYRNQGRKHDEVDKILNVCSHRGYCRLSIILYFLVSAPQCRRSPAAVST